MLDVSTGKTLPDAVQWVKFSNISWTNGDNGFFYSRYPTPPKGNAINQQVVDQQLYFHALGQPQSADRLIYRRPDLPHWIIEGQVSEDGRYLFVALINGTAPQNELYYADLGNPAQPDVAAKLEPLYTRNDAAYVVVGVEKGTLYLQTTLDAPKGRVVAASLSDPAPAHWRTVIPEGRGVIQEADMADGNVVVHSQIDATSRLTLYTTDGKAIRDLPLPTLGTVTAVSARNDSNSVYFGFTSYLYPGRIYRYDLRRASTQTVFAPQASFDSSLYETRLVFYPSKDGTRVPMFIVARKGLKLNGRNPTILYGYGGFDITMQPDFSPIVPVWLELGGVYVEANLRGGGTYGEKWHQAGMLVAQAERVRRLRLGREIPDRAPLYRCQAHRDPGVLQRRSAHGRFDHAASRAVRRRLHRARRAGHAALPGFLGGRALVSRIWCLERRARVQMALRLLTAA